MQVKLAIASAAATMMLATGTVSAGIVEYKFSWDHGESTWFQFASTEWISQILPPPTIDEDYWTADVEDDTTVLGLLDSHHPVRDTAKTVNGSTVQMEFVIEDVTGTIDLVNETADWSITGYVRFRAAGQVSATSCRTSSFNVTFDDNYNSGSYSDVFTVPALSGSGSQACSGHASTLNSAFALGSSGAYLYFNKFTITPV